MFAKMIAPAVSVIGHALIPEFLLKARGIKAEEANIRMNIFAGLAQSTDVQINIAKNVPRLPVAWRAS